MFSDIKFWRLVWKEYRTQRPLWLVMAMTTPLLQIGILVMAKLLSSPPYTRFDENQTNPFMAIGFVATVVYMLGCCATMFSVEHEAGTFDFQKVLPANQRQVFWAKVGFAAVSTLLLSLFLWMVIRVGILEILVRVLFDQKAPGTSTWFGTYGLLYMAELFVWSILASLLVRHPLWAVIVAISMQTVAIQLALPYLTTGQSGFDLLLHDDRLYFVMRFVVLVLVAAADIVLGKRWYDDRMRLPRCRFGLKPDIAPSYPAGGDLRPYLGQRQVGWSRLMWLGWRDARWVIGAVLVWYVVCLRVTPTLAQWHALMLPYFIGSFVCGLFTFAPEQWGCRFRFATERGCSPRIVWLSRQVTWLPTVVLMTLVVDWLLSNNLQAFQRDLADSQFEWSAALIGPFVCYSAGQFAAMLCRSTVMALAVGLFLTILGIIWALLMTTWLAPIWWSIGSLPVIGLFVTWLRANDWIVERRDRVARLRFALGLGVPVVLLLAACATYRVIQIPTVTLPSEWDETPQVLARLTPAEKETLAVYRRALVEIERGEDQLETYEARKTRLAQEHADWTANQIHAEAFTGFHRDWLAQNVVAVPLLREAHRMPPVPLALIEAGLPDRPNDWNPERLAKLPWLMVRQAEQSLKSGQLDQTWDDIVVAFELQRRFDLRASLPRELFAPRMASAHEDHLLLIVANWGRHKEQTRDRILVAIRKLEEIAAGREAIQHAAHHEFLDAKGILKFDERWREHVKRSGPQGQHSDAEFAVLRTAWNAMFWERWRSQRVLRWLSSLAITRAEDLTRLIVANQPLSSTRLRDTGIGWKSEEMTMAHTTLLPPNVANGLSVGNLLINRMESFRATMLLLALSDFHRAHGRYPESLSELAPTYFTEAPRDPSSAGPFIYYPHGLSEEVTDGDEARDPVRVIIRQGVPFLSTAGTSYNISTRALPDGTWAFEDHFGKVLPPSTAFKHKKVWRLENATEESK